MTLIGPETQRMVVSFPITPPFMGRAEERSGEGSPRKKNMSLPQGKEGVPFRSGGSSWAPKVSCPYPLRSRLPSEGRKGGEKTCTKGSFCQGKKFRAAGGRRRKENKDIMCPHCGGEGAMEDVGGVEGGYRFSKKKKSGKIKEDWGGEKNDLGRKVTKGKLN